MSRWLRFAPLFLLVVVLAGLVWRLATPVDTSVHSRMEGQKVPSFALAPGVPGKPGLTSADLATGRPVLLNVFASWCVPCITEVGVLRQMQARGVTIDGLAVRDQTDDLQAFLARNGDPYQRIGSDPQSKMQIDLGSSGVPETFIIDGGGVIRYQHIGPIDASEVPAILAKLEAAK